MYGGRARDSSSFHLQLHASRILNLEQTGVCLQLHTTCRREKSFKSTQPSDILPSSQYRSTSSLRCRLFVIRRVRGSSCGDFHLDMALSLSIKQHSGLKHCRAAPCPGSTHPTAIIKHSSCLASS